MVQFANTNNLKKQSQDAFTGFPYAEFISQKGNTASAAFSYGQGSQAALTIDCNAGDVTDVALALLGFDSYTRGFGNMIARVLPARHPQWPGWFCTRITRCEGVRFIGKVNDGMGPRAGHTMKRLTALFEPLPYSLVDDSTLFKLGFNESARYVERTESTRLETITRQVGEFNWGTDVGCPTPGDPFAGFAALLLKKRNVILTWHRVPEDYLYNANFRSPQIDACEGHINLNPVLGYATGQVLLNPVKKTPLPMPFNFDILVPGVVNPARLYTVEMTFTCFDPPGNDDNAVQGWNSAPHPKNSKFYTIVAKDNVSLPYKYADFAQLFHAAPP